MRPAFTKAAAKDAQAIKAHVDATGCQCTDCDSVDVDAFVGVAQDPSVPHIDPLRPSPREPGLRGMSNFGQILAENSARTFGTGGPETVSVKAAAALAGKGKKK